MTDKLVTTRTEPHEFVLAPRPGLEHGCYCGEPRDAAIHALVTRTERQLRREADATAALTASSDADGTGSQVESMESEAEKWGRLAEVMIPNEAPMKTWARRAAIEFCGLLGDEQRDRILAAIDTLRAANADLHGYAAKQRAEISDLRVEVESLKGKNELLVRTVEYSRGEVERLTRERDEALLQSQAEEFGHNECADALRAALALARAGMEALRAENDFAKCGHFLRFIVPTADGGSACIACERVEMELALTALQALTAGKVAGAWEEARGAAAVACLRVRGDEIIPAGGALNCMDTIHALQNPYTKEPSDE